MNQSIFDCNDDNQYKKRKIDNKCNDTCNPNCYQVIPGIGPTGP